MLLNFDEIIESRDSMPMNNKYAHSLKEREKGLSQEEVIIDTSEKSAIFDRKSTEILLDSNKKVGWFSWKNRQFSFKGVKTKEEALIKKTDNKNRTDVDPHESNDSSTFDSINNDAVQVHILYH